MSLLTRRERCYLKHRPTKREADRVLHCQYRQALGFFSSLYRGA